MESKRLQTAKKFIALFETLDTLLLETILAPDYVHQYAPASMNPPGPFDKQGQIDHINNLRGVLSGFPVTAKEYFESDSRSAVTVWATGQAIFRDDVKDDGVPPDDWNYTGEYIFILTMDETGERITRTVEFLDSKNTAEKLSPLAKRANGNRARRLDMETL